MEGQRVTYSIYLFINTVYCACRNLLESSIISFTKQAITAKNISPNQPNCYYGHNTIKCQPANVNDGRNITGLKTPRTYQSCDGTMTTQCHSCNTCFTTRQPEWFKTATNATTIVTATTNSYTTDSSSASLIEEQLPLNVLYWNNQFHYCRLHRYHCRPQLPIWQSLHNYLTDFYDKTFTSQRLIPYLLQ